MIITHHEKARQCILTVVQTAEIIRLIGDERVHEDLHAKGIKAMWST